jgi:membrane protease subunit HflK
MAETPIIEFPRRFPKLPAGRFGGLIVGLLVLVLAVSAFYQVAPEEVGVVLRFGKFIKTTDPGLHVKIPFGVDRVIKVAAQRQLKQEFGFRTISANVRSTKEEDQEESLMLTGDLNAALVEWVVQYRVTDPERYLFRVRNVTETLRYMSEAVMRTVVGDRTVNEVLTVGRQEIADLVEQHLQRLCDEYETGITVEQVVLQNVNPPDAVKDSFNEVNRAQQEKETLINQAQAQYNSVIPRARGEALKTIEAAEGYALDRVNRSHGDAARFESLYAAYRSAPEVTRRRIYLETMERILPAMGRTIVVDDSLEGLLPLLQLGSGAEPGSRPPAASAQGARPDGGGG